jgi:hypothetical protein
MVYFVMTIALFAEDDYEEVAARLTQTLRGWGSWQEGWEVPTRGGIAQARARLGPESVEELFGQVADLDTAGAFLGPWRLMSVDGMEWDVPDTKGEPGRVRGQGRGRGVSAYPKARMVTVAECGSHAPVLVGHASGPVSAFHPDMTYFRRL